jgi:putative hemolysin
LRFAAFAKGLYPSGALVGIGAVIDHQFNMVDVFVLMPMQQLSECYRQLYASK